MDNYYKFVIYREGNDVFLLELEILNGELKTKKIPINEVGYQNIPQR